MSGRHTKGPWVARYGNADAGVFSSSLYPGRRIAHATSYWQGDGPRRDERDANARLIAAAPELLDACEYMMAYCYDAGEPRFEDGEEVCPAELMREAIAKAKGGDA